MAKSMSEKINKNISLFDEIRAKNIEKAHKLSLSRKVLRISNKSSLSTYKLLDAPCSLNTHVKPYNLKLHNYYTPPSQSSMLTKKQKDLIKSKMNLDAEYIDLKKPASACKYKQFKQLLHNNLSRSPESHSKSSKCWFRISKLSQKLKQSGGSDLAINIQQIKRNRLLTI